MDGRRARLAVLIAGLVFLGLYLVTGFIGALDAERRNGLFMLWAILSFGVPDVRSLTGRHGERGPLSRRADAIADGARLFMIVFGLGTGVALLGGLLAPLAWVAYLVVFGTLLLSLLSFGVDLLRDGLPPGTIPR